MDAIVTICPFLLRSMPGKNSRISMKCEIKFTLKSFSHWALLVYKAVSLIAGSSTMLGVEYLKHHLANTDTSIVDQDGRLSMRLTNLFAL